MSQPLFPAPQVTVLLLAVYAAAATLVGVWAATSERHWFWRALGVWACVAVLLPIRMYEPAMALVVGLPLLAAIVAGVRFWRRMDGHSARLRFGLTDLLLLMVVTALALVIVTGLAKQGPRVNVVEILAPGAVLAMLGAIVTWVVRGPWRPLATALLACAVPVSALLVWPRAEWLYAIEALEISEYTTTFGSQTYWAGFRRTLFGVEELSASLLLGCLLLLARPAKSSRERLLFAARCLAGASLLGVGVWLYGQFWKQREFPPSLDTAENRAGRVFEIGGQLLQLNPQFVALRQGMVASFDERREQELSRLYRELLELLESPNCMVQPEPDRVRAHFTETLIKQAQEARHILRCLEAEWVAATAEGELDRAIELALACVRLGAMHGRNSIDNECLLGEAFIGVPTAYFVKERETFDRAQAARIKAALKRAEREHEPLQIIHQRDVAYSDRAYGWQRSVSRIVYGARWDDGIHRQLQDIHCRWRTIVRLLKADFAIRQFRQDHGTVPASLEPLVPDYFDQVPDDPPSGRPMLYRPEGDGYVLCSVGRDRKDHGGRFGDRLSYLREGYDFDLDTLWRP